MGRSSEIRLIVFIFPPGIVKMLCFVFLSRSLFDLLMPEYFFSFWSGCPTLGLISSMLIRRTDTSRWSEGTRHNVNSFLSFRRFRFRIEGSKSTCSFSFPFVVLLSIIRIATRANDGVWNELSIENRFGIGWIPAFGVRHNIQNSWMNWALKTVCFAFPIHRPTSWIQDFWTQIFWIHRHGIWSSKTFG